MYETRNEKEYLLYQYNLVDAVMSGRGIVSSRGKSSIQYLTSHFHLKTIILNFTSGHAIYFSKHNCVVGDGMHILPVF